MYIDVKEQHYLTGETEYHIGATSSEWLTSKHSRVFWLTPKLHYKQRKKKKKKSAYKEIPKGKKTQSLEKSQKSLWGLNW